MMVKYLRFVKLSKFGSRKAPKLCISPQNPLFLQARLIPINIKSNYYKMARSHDLLVKVEDLQPIGRGFESWCRILDRISFALKKR